MLIDFDFTQPPAIGSRHYSRNDMLYTVTGVTPYTRKSDGAASYLIDWRSFCPDCAKSFTLKSGMRNVTLNRRCSQCASPRRPSNAIAKKLSLAGKAEGRRIQAEMRAARKRDK